MRFAVSLVLAGAFCATLQAQTSSRFAAYTRCKFDDGLALVENTPLAKGVEGRTVKTIMGPRQVPLAGGVRLMYAYPNTEPLANAKVEQIPAAEYDQAKQDLIANFEQILTADDSSSRNYALKPRMNTLEIYGLDRRKLEGGVLGIYLFFADRTHTVTTIYFLNQDPALRKFDNLEDYAKLRDAFLDSYTRCAAGRPRQAAERVVSADGRVTPLPGTEPTQRLATVSPGAAPAMTDLPDAPLPNAVPAGQPATSTEPPAIQPAMAHPAPGAKKASAKTAPAKSRKSKKSSPAPRKKQATKAKAPVKKKKQ